jgi:sugar-phosphatase
LATARLKFCGLPVPKVLITADQVTHGKPHPEPYLKGAEGLGLAPAECLVIEDAPAGIQAGQTAGMKVIGMASTYAPKFLQHADIVVASLGAIHVALNHVASNGKGKLTLSIR